MNLNADPQATRLTLRIRELEHALDQALWALNAAATVKQRTRATERIRKTLTNRRSLALAAR